ncbi:MAG TPA: SDR family oxidoreductase [Fluviicoccus sp.]|nr:SDR family oxidoreductase [Fluviicoccus sp.]
MNFRNRVVFVAGGSSGINLGIAEAFAEAGAHLAIFSRSAEKLAVAAAQLAKHGGRVLSFSGDVRDYESVSLALTQTAAELGPLDVLVSGAAGNFLCPAASLSANGFKTVVDIDLLGTFNVMRAAWPHLRKPGASIINITAAQSWLAVPNQVHVCAAKAGIDQITRTLALEWGEAGVRINSIAPGPIAGTEGMARLAPTAESVAAWTQAVPLRRFGQLKDISDAALWLCSAQAAFITGVVLPVDGGLSLSGSGAIGRAMVG